MRSRSTERHCLLVFPTVKVALFYSGGGGGGVAINYILEETDPSTGVGSNICWLVVE